MKNNVEGRNVINSSIQKGKLNEKGEEPLL